MSRRRLPPIASDADRIQAARIVADQICAQMRESELARAVWTDEKPHFEHFIDSVGGITSERHDTSKS